jgi:hypothetical protein
MIGRLPVPTIHRIGAFDNVVNGVSWYQKPEKSGWYIF